MKTTQHSESLVTISRTSIGLQNRAFIPIRKPRRLIIDDRTLRLSAVTRWISSIIDTVRHHPSTETEVGCFSTQHLICICKVVSDQLKARQ